MELPLRRTLQLYNNIQQLMQGRMFTTTFVFYKTYGNIFALITLSKSKQ